MSNTARSIKSTALTTPKYITTNEALLERLRTVETARKGDQPIPLKQGKDEEVNIKKWEVELIAEGGYNHIWLVT